MFLLRALTAKVALMHDLLFSRKMLNHSLQPISPDKRHLSLQTNKKFGKKRAAETKLLLFI